MSADPISALQMHDLDTLPGPSPTPADEARTATLTTSVPLLDKLLVTRPELSQLTSLDVRTLARMDAANEIPGRIKIGRSVRYDLSVIKEWIAAGCDIARWKALQRGKR